MLLCGKLAHGVIRADDPREAAVIEKRHLRSAFQRHDGQVLAAALEGITFGDNGDNGVRG